VAGRTNRLEAPWLDAALHLLDRQVVDRAGLMVCNVDDLEITESASGALAVTGILVGPAALWPRLSGVVGDWLREMWLRLGIQYDGRDVPSYLGLDLVREIGSSVLLDVDREGILVRQPAPTTREEKHRLGELVGMRVRTPSGDDLGKVLDVRLAPRGSRSDRRLELTHLVVGRGRPGSLLGYDRGDFRGPWLVRRLVEALHRHTGTLDLGSLERLDWERGRIVARGPLGPLA
jgi:sporulation protein YlmC with PRC-barrel domain